MTPSSPRSSRITLLSLATLAAAASLHAAEAAPTPPAETKLADKVVSAERETARVDNTAMKMPDTLHETPRSVTVIDSERIRETNYNSLDDTLDSTPGMFVNSRNAGGYHFISRGFRMTGSETRVDGFRNVVTGSGMNSLPLYGVEKVVILRGPAAILYGAAPSPGGLINVVMRKPEETQRTTLDLTTNTYHGNGRSIGERVGVGAELDSTGALSDEWLYRVGVAADNMEHYTADVTNQTRFIQGAVTWKPLGNDRIRITPLVQHLETKTPPGAGMVISPSSSLSTNDGSSKVNTDDLTSLDINTYEGFRKDHLTIAGVDFHADNDDGITLYAGYRFINNGTDLNTWSPVVTTAAQRADLVNNGLVWRTQTKRQAITDSHNFDVNGAIETPLGGGVSNRFMAGVNGSYTQASARNAAGPLGTPQAPVNIHTGATAGVVDNATGWQRWVQVNTFEFNTYAQNRTAVFDERLVLTLGVGYGELFTENGSTQRGDVTPNAALLWNVTKELATYVSYSTSYGFASGTAVYENAAGNNFIPNPSKGDNKEIGVKYRLPGRKSNVGAAYFRAEQTDVLTQSAPGDLNPNGNRYYFTMDGQSTEGVELAASLFLTDNWNLDGTFAWITGAYNNGTAFDEPLAKTPEYSASLFSRYRITEGSFKGLSHYVGVTWQDERLGGNGSRTAAAPDPLMLPAFYRVDAGIEYAVNTRLKVGFHVYNVLDEVIVVDGTTGANIQIDAPRTYTLKATYAF